MATKQTIITLPNEHLRQRSKRVGIITDDIRNLVSEMGQSTLDWEDSREHELGIALAAVQTDELLRVIVIRNNFEDKSDRSFQCFINPEIAKLEGAIVEDFEGCLSIRDVYGKVPRYEKVRIKALDIDGKEIRVAAEGFLARVFQHEIDHTNGIVFIDHIKDNPEAFYRLTAKGHLEEQDYEKDIKNSRLLW
ncbi:peptide deformylase [soil metagenome]